MDELLFKDETYAILGAAMEVYNHLGPGFLEAVYQEAMEIELTSCDIPFVPQPELSISHKGRVLKKYYVADFLIFDNIIVELKAISVMTGVDESQLHNELKATSYPVGLLINFGSPKKLQWIRRANTKHRDQQTQESSA